MLTSQSLRYFARMSIVRFLCLMLGTAVSGQAASQVSVAFNYSEKIKARTEIAGLGPELFGDKVDLYTGRTSFVHEDINVPGDNELQVRFARAYSPDSLIRSGVLGDWYPDLPRISGIFPISTGWQSSMPADPNRRCSVDTTDYMKATPPNTYGNNGGAFSSAEFWTGNTLYIPGGGEQRLLVIAPSNLNRPTSGGPYYWVTDQNYIVSCINTTANGVPGEGFQVTSPSGLKYQFDWLAKVASPYFLTLRKPVTVCTVPMPQCETTLNRAEYWWLPTRVEDRFGNYVTYTYDAANPARLTSIQANDGRAITFAYNANGQISQATANGRTWTYVYSLVSSGGESTVWGYVLDQVVLPDNSFWAFDLRSVPRRNNPTALHADCTGPPPPGTIGVGAIGSMTHPSGATGNFKFVLWRHGRSHVPRSCVQMPFGGSYAAYSTVVDTVSLSRKSLQGPGIDGEIAWDYVYEDGRLSPSGWSFADQCVSSPCQDTKTTTVTASDGTWKKYSLVKKYGVMEGLVVGVSTGIGQSEKQNVTYQLVDPQFQSWFVPTLGKDPCYLCDHTGEAYRVTSRTTITQDGVSFKHETTEFDLRARPIRSTRSSAPAP